MRVTTHISTTSSTSTRQRNPGSPPDRWRSRELATQWRWSRTSPRTALSRPALPFFGKTFWVFELPLFIERVQKIFLIIALTVIRKVIEPLPYQLPFFIIIALCFHFEGFPQYFCIISGAERNSSCFITVEFQSCEGTDWVYSECPTQSTKIPRVPLGRPVVG